MKENTIEIILVEDNPADVELTLSALKERAISPTRCTCSRTAQKPSITS
jgi:hypothetical protein